MVKLKFYLISLFLFIFQSVLAQNMNAINKHVQVPKESFIMSNEIRNASALGSTVAYYHFDESQGTIVSDASGNGYTGTIYGATWTTGVSGSALNFDGINDYVQVPSASSLSFLNFTLK